MTLRGPAVAGSVLVAVALLFAACDRAPEPGEPSAPTAERRAATPEAPAGHVVLLFPDEAGGLTPERRPIPLEGSSGQRVAQLVDALLAGPETPGLAPPFPAGVAVGAVLVDSRGVAFIDLVASEMANPPPSGSRVELQRIYSIVNTVLANVEPLQAVVLLWNGRQRPSFGHVDTAHPLLSYDELLISEAGA